MHIAYLFMVIKYPEIIQVSYYKRAWNVLKKYSIFNLYKQTCIKIARCKVYSGPCENENRRYVYNTVENKKKKIWKMNLTYVQRASSAEIKNLPRRKIIERISHRCMILKKKEEKKTEYFYFGQ